MNVYSLIGAQGAAQRAFPASSSGALCHLLGQRAIVRNCDETRISATSPVRAAERGSSSPSGAQGGGGQVPHGGAAPTESVLLNRRDALDRKLGRYGSRRDDARPTEPAAAGAGGSASSHVPVSPASSPSSSVRPLPCWCTLPQLIDGAARAIGRVR